MNLFVAIPIRQSDAHLTEPLLDWIRELNGGNPTETHVLLSYAKNVHGEQRAKIRIAAELAFQSVDEVVTGVETANEVELGNKLFKEMAQAIGERYRWPWLCLHPACVPLLPSWIAVLGEEYDKQPKRYLGPHLKATLGGRETMVLGRTSIYPASAFNELREYCDGMIGYEFLSAPRIVPRSTATKLVQFGSFSDPNRLRPDMMIYDGDKTGQLMETSIQRLKAKLDSLTIKFGPDSNVESCGDAYESPLSRRGSYVSAFEEPKPETNGHAKTGTCETFTMPDGFVPTVKCGIERVEVASDQTVGSLTVDQLAKSVVRKTGRVKDLADRLKTDEQTIKALMEKSGGRILVGRGAWLKVKDA